jgi:tRNA (guanine37-N1)-methyltransferase
MNISIITVFKELYEPFLNTSLIKRAQQKGLVDIDLHSFFSFVQPKERIDAPMFGHGAGMLIKPVVVEQALTHCKERKGADTHTIFFSPQGQMLDQTVLRDLATKIADNKHLILVPARYEGMDARVEQVYADQIISIGNYVLMGGDLPAMVLLEGLLRYVPGVVGKEFSVEHDSFTGSFVDYPSYTEPLTWQGLQVPEILRSGNHQAVDRWRNEKAADLSVKKHFGWVKSHVKTQEDRRLAAASIPHHYVALCHSDVLIGPEKLPGTTSVTSLDIHDIARSCKTYGIRGYSIVTPLHDQQKVVQKLLEFWASDVGTSYNPQRQSAIELVDLQESIDAVIEQIEQKEGKKPLLVATSARALEGQPLLSFYEQDKVWQHDRPVLFIFGTGKGLTPELLKRCDYILAPVQGFTDFNHLSVRSAVAIILDRWLGINLEHP